jgi:hypothetical protein
MYSIKLDTMIQVLYVNVVDNGMTKNNLSTPISDDLLRRIRAFLDGEADMVTGSNDPAQEAEPNEAMMLLRELDAATDGEFR